MQIQIIELEDGTKRIIHGEYAEIFKLNYTKSLTELKKDVELALLIFQREYQKKELFFFRKRNIQVYEGNHHLEIINNGMASMNWLTIEDMVLSH